MIRTSRAFLSILVLICLSTGISSASIKEEIKNYEMIVAMTLIRSRIEGHFTYYIAPCVPQVALIGKYPKYLEKRYSKRRILEEAKTIVSIEEGKLVVAFIINFTGDWRSRGKTSKEIPDDFNEYLFLENDKGDFIRCTKADILVMGNIVNVINPESSILFTFPLMYKKNGKQFSILEDTEYIEFIIGGLGLKDNRFRYKLPLFIVTDNTPEPLKELFIELGLTEYPLGAEIEPFDRILQDILEKSFIHMQKGTLPEISSHFKEYPAYKQEENEKQEEISSQRITGPVGGRGILRSAEPEYPASAEASGMKGEVELKFWVLPGGEVSEVEVLKTSGWSGFDSSASQVLREWRFEPIEEKEKQWGIISFFFEFEEQRS